MLTEKDYCDYETCVALKELGCTYTTLFRYIIDDESIPHPTLYEAQKFLREEMGVIVYPQYLTNGQNWMCMVYEKKKMLMHSVGRGIYNEVLNEGIKEAVKILKDE